MRRAATVLLTAALTSAGGWPRRPRRRRRRHRAVDLTITVTDLGPEVRTCDIDADLYVPAGVHRDAPGPALLATNGFGGAKNDQADLAQGFGELGYVTLSYTGIGFTDGDNCPITLDDVEHDGAAASQLIRFLGGDPSIVAVDDATGETVRRRPGGPRGRDHRQPYDPQVGMTGGSYGGQIQFAAAGFESGRHRPTRRDRPADHLERPLLLPGAGEQRPPRGHRAQRLGELAGTGVFKYQWASLFTTVGVRDGAEDLPPPLLDPAQRAQPAEQLRQLRARRSAGPSPRSARGYPSEASIDVPAVQLRLQLHGRHDGAHADRPGPGRHPVQPAGVGRDLYRAQGAGHAGLAGVAVVGPQRLHPVEPASSTCGTPPSRSRAGRRWPGSTTTCGAGAGPAAELHLLPRLGVRGHARHHEAYATAPPTRSAGSRPTTSPAPAPPARTAPW